MTDLDVVLSLKWDQASPERELKRSPPSIWKPDAFSHDLAHLREILPPRAEVETPSRPEVDESHLQKEIAQLREMIEELRRERDSERRELAELRAQLVALPLATRTAPGHARKPRISEPTQDWLRNHLELLEEYPDHFVAIDMEQEKVVLASTDDVEFNRQLLEYTQGDKSIRNRLLTVHTSLYV